MTATAKAYQTAEYLQRNEKHLQPLCVDLDDTLVLTDTLLESFLSLFRRAPVRALVSLFSLFAGKAAFKARLSKESVLDVTHLPYNALLLDFIRHERAQGRLIVLATGAHKDIAYAVAGHLGLFDQVICTQGRTNNVGRKKAEALNVRFKETGFWYAGSSNADLSAWKASSGAIIVGNHGRFTEQLGRLGVPLVWKCSSTTSSGWKSYLKEIRVHQWLKNLLIFVPALTAHLLTNLHVLFASFLAAAALSLVASSLYVFNDLIDLADDRKNPTKNSRPLASGAITLQTGVALGAACAVLGLAISAFLPPAGRLVLFVYAIGSFLYSWKLKGYLMMDVVGLASLYTIRVFMGGCSTNIVVSSWLFVYSMFLFLCLAHMKRTSELVSVNRTDSRGIPGRAYLKSDFDQMASMGSASGYIAVLVFGFYLRSPEVTRLYTHPDRMWILCLLQIYWLSRLLVLAHRGTIEGDPILFILKDRLSYVVGFAALLIIALAV